MSGLKSLYSTRELNRHNLGLNNILTPISSSCQIVQILTWTSESTLSSTARFVATWRNYRKKWNIPDIILNILMLPFRPRALYLENKPSSTKHGPSSLARHLCKAYPIAGVTCVSSERQKLTSTQPVFKYNKCWRTEPFNLFIGAHSKDHAKGLFSKCRKTAIWKWSGETYQVTQYDIEGSVVRTPPTPGTLCSECACQFPAISSVLSNEKARNAIVKTGENCLQRKQWRDTAKPHTSGIAHKNITLLSLSHQR